MHKSVLLEECIKNLALQDNSIIVDCTLGFAGHSSEILKQIPNGKLYAFDQDSYAVATSKKRLEEIIRQIEAKALRKLRHPSRSRKLKDYMSE